MALFSIGEVEEALKDISKNLGIVLKEEQKEALKQLAFGGDLLAVLPTGFGKSLIFQLLVLLLEKLTKEKCCVLVVCPLKSILEDRYDKEYQKTFLNKMRLKLGLLNKHLAEDEELIESLFDTMQETGADFTNTFRCLSKVQAQDQQQSSETNKNVITYLVSQCQTLEELRKTTQPNLGDRQLEMFLLLIQSNPHLLEQLGGSVELIHKAMEKKEKNQKLKETNPTEKIEKDSQLWTTWISKYSARLADDFKDCDDKEEAQGQRVSTMNANNPRFILRNYIAQNAISAAEKGDFTEVQRVLKLLQTPYSDNISLSDLQPATQERETPEVLRDEDGASSSSSYVDTNSFTYDSKPPDWSLDLRVT